MRPRALVLSSGDDARHLGLPAFEPFEIYIPLCAEARYSVEALGLRAVLPGCVVGQQRHEELSRRVQDETDRIVALVNEHFARPPASPANIGECFRFVIYNHLARYSAIAHILDCASQLYDVSYIEGPLRRDTYLSASASEVVATVAASRENLRVARLGITKSGPPNATPSVVNENVANVSAGTWVKTFALAGVNGLLWARAALRVRWSSPVHKAIVLNGFKQWFTIGSSPHFRANVRLKLIDVGDEPLERLRGPALPADLVERLSRVTCGRIPVKAMEDLAARLVKFASYVEKIDAEVERQIADVRMVVGSVFDTPLGRYYCSKAIRQHKDVVVFQHGAMNLHPEPRDMASVEADATQYLSWGNATDRKREQLEGFGRLKNIWVVGAVKNKVKYRGGDTVVYATGKYFSNTHLTHYVDPDGRLYDAQKALLRFFEQQQLSSAGHVRFVVKVNNTRGANEIPFPTTVPIDSRSRFVDLMADAKAVVLDSPATTCVEAAATRVPLFVLMGRTKWYDAAVEKLSKRAVVCDSLDELTSALDAFLVSGTYDADVENMEFAEAYFGVESVGTSVERIAAVLSSLTAGAA